MRIRISIHVGDVVVRDGDVHGDGVNLAARIEPLAGPGGIVVSRAVHEQVGNKLGAPLARLGRAELKNIEGGLEVFRVVLTWQRGAPTRMVTSAAEIYYRHVAGEPNGIYRISKLGGEERLVLDHADSPNVLADGSLIVGKRVANGHYRLPGFQHRRALYPFHPDC